MNVDEEENSDYGSSRGSGSYVEDEMVDS